MKNKAVLLLVLSLFVVLTFPSLTWAVDTKLPSEGEFNNEEEGEKVYILEPIIVTATRTEREVFNIPKAVTLVETREIGRKNNLSVLDGLNDKIGIWVEKRTTTTSDLVIRGMSGFNILALIDGNTLSTLWGEGGVAGDDMYGKVDADNVERIEVVKGPTSVLYGSNALAGVINFITKSSPYDFTEEGTRLGALTKLSFASAAREKRIRTEVYGATPNFRFIVGTSYRDVEDARGGRGIGLQVPTSGEELNWDFKVEFRPKLSHTLEFSFQNINRDELYRFYRPTQTNFNDRTGASLKYKGSRIFSSTDKLNFTLYYQYKKDTRKWFETIEKIKEKETGWAITKTYCSDLQWSNLFKGNHLFTSGVHFELDDGEDPDDEQFTHRTETGTRKDAPDSYWTNYALYLQDEWNLSSRLQITLGARWDRFNFESRLDSLYQPLGDVDPSIDKINESEDALTGGVGILYGITDNINLFTNLSRGFRQYAPVFGIKEHAYGIQVPSGLLDPSVSLNSEFGVKFRSNRLRGSSIIYYTDLRDLPVVLPGTFQGKDWYDWNNNGTPDPGEDVYVTQSAAKAYVYGIEIEGEYSIGSGWSFYAGFNWNYGKDITNDEPLRHTVPAWGLVKLIWDEPETHKIWLELTAEMASSFDRIPSDRIYKDPGYRVDPQDMNSPLIGPNGEVPGWIIFNLRGEYLLNKNVRINFAVENFTNEAYRRVHSRWDALGVNFILGLTFTI